MYTLKPIFTWDTDQYVRDFNVVKNYVNQSAYFLSVMKGTPLKQTHDTLVQKYKNKELRYRNPTIHYVGKDEVGDARLTSTPLLSYIKDNENEGHITVPTFTTYLNRPSPLSDFMDVNKKARSIIKKQGLEAKAKGDIETFVIKDRGQNNRKILNNSVSGAFATKGCALYNPTAHSTLTTITRMETSIANALNEKLIGGNRHYFSTDTILNNITFIAQRCSREAVEEAMQTYGLHYPTPEETMDVIKYSADLYVQEIKKMRLVEAFIRKIEPYQRAAICYTNDLYHLRKYNDAFMRQMFSKIITLVEPYDGDDPVGEIYKYDESIVNFVSHLFMDELKGLGKNYAGFPEDLVRRIVGKCADTVKVFTHYQTLIKAFFVTWDMPASAAHIKSQVRRVVVLSDTDSTMFSADEWVFWYYNTDRFTPKGYSITGVISMFSSQVVTHNLAIYSAQMGVDKDKLFKIKMKPEFVFPVFCQTPVAKHYFTAKVFQEGVAYTDIDHEIKGVHLKNSALPKEVIDYSHDTIDDIIRTVMRGEKLKAEDYLNRLYDIEQKIYQNVMERKADYFRVMVVKDAGAYKGEEDKSNYWFYKLWETVFRPKYKYKAEVPFQGYYVQLRIANKTQFNEFLASIKDEALRDRLVTFLKDTGKSALGTIVLPTGYVESHGVPEEIVDWIDVDRLILTVTKSMRMIVESLGIGLMKDMPLIRYVRKEKEVA